MLEQLFTDPSLLQILVTGTLGLLSIVGGWFGFGKLQKKKKERDEALENLIREVNNTNKLLVKSLDSNGDLLRELNSNFMLVNEPILIDNKNQGTILKDAIFQKFGKVFSDKMKEILIENHIDNEERTKIKIESSIKTLLKNTYEKIYVINGLINYIRPLDEVLEIIKEFDTYNLILELMKKAKADKDYDFKYELFALFEVVYTKTSL